MTYNDVLIIISVLFAGSIIFLILILWQKRHLLVVLEKDKKIQQLLVEKYIFNKEIKINCSTKKYVSNLFILSQKFKFSKDSLDKIYTYLNQKKYIQKLYVNINSNSPYKRARAIAYLALFKNDKTKSILCERLLLEQKENIKILIVNSLKYNIDQKALRCIITSLISSKRYYQERVINILKRYIDQSQHDLSSYFKSPLMEIKEAFVELALNIFHPSFKQPLLDTLNEIEDHYIHHNSNQLKKIQKTRVDRLYYQTLEALSRFYAYDLSNIKYLSNIDNEVVKIAVNSLTRNGDFSTIKYLLTFSSQSQQDSIFTEGINKICDKNKAYYKDLYELFKITKSNREKQLIAGVLSNKIDYIILSIKGRKHFELLINFMIKSRYSINIINWLNSNKDPDIENQMLEIIKPIAEDNYEFYTNLNNYLRRDLFRKLGYVYSFFPGKDKPVTNPETKKTRWLVIFLFVCFLILPVIFFVFNTDILAGSTIREVLTRYIVSINKSFIGYYLVVNFLYLFFAFIAMIEYHRQEKLWRIKNDDFLYEDGILSPISIIVPAYNEEINIIDSLTSLLSLKYPNYEVIVVNDGSKDNTLQKIIDAFELKRVDFTVDNSIATMPIKAVYKNKFYTKLTLIDKENGGKADSLNVGINFSKHDYICGIDADSLIEPNGLLRMMSTVLDHDSITLALGGSIVPINGATVNNGVVEAYRLPKSTLAKFQTIEYIRAFNAGRLGFSNMKCFLIVSGAFGLFEKRMLKEIGGYLTASNMRKDTVGEDMELVVRIARKASERGLTHRIQYVPMARCYTEVPEDRKSLFAQRNRWQKGLIDTLSFHRKMIFNPKYGTNGTIAMPYFFIFEMLGPVLEIQVYLSLLIGFFFGIFDGVLLLLLFAVTMVLGMFATLVSIFLQEKYTEPFTLKDTAKLLFFTMIENFGWRQLVSIYRSIGYFTSFKAKQSWGKMERKGFNK